MRSGRLRQILINPFLATNQIGTSLVMSNVNLIAILIFYFYYFNFLINILQSIVEVVIPGLGYVMIDKPFMGLNMPGNSNLNDVRYFNVPYLPLYIS